MFYRFRFKKKTKKLLKNEKENLGDIIINLNKIKNKNIKDFKNKFDQLWIHGLVHLFGHDHKREKDYVKMHLIEKKYIYLINAR